MARLADLRWRGPYKLTPKANQQATGQKQLTVTVGTIFL
jgi:hypothetical protein